MSEFGFKCGSSSRGRLKAQFQHIYNQLVTEQLESTPFDVFWWKGGRGGGNRESIDFPGVPRQQFLITITIRELLEICTVTITIEAFQEICTITIRTRALQEICIITIPSVALQEMCIITITIVALQQICTCIITITIGAPQEISMCYEVTLDQNVIKIMILCSCFKCHKQ